MSLLNGHSCCLLGTPNDFALAEAAAKLECRDD